jgi:hypothetical protein
MWCGIPRALPSPALPDRRVLLAGSRSHGPPSSYLQGGRRQQARAAGGEARGLRPHCNETHMAGYSGTPLSSKLGIRAGWAIHLHGAPADYRRLLEPLPEGVRFDSHISTTTDLVQVFTARTAELAKLLRTCRSRLRPTAVLWVSWPKKSSTVPADVAEDTIRDLALPLGFVDIKVCAVTDVWSGLKLVVRKELR